MNDINKFQELIGKTLETAKSQGNTISVSSIKELFSDMDLSETQFNQISAFLISNRIEVEGYEKSVVPTQSASLSSELYTPKEINSKDTAYLDQYLDELKSIQKGTKEEEMQLLEKIKQGDGSSKGRFIELNLQKVVEIAGEYKNQGMTLEDLIQEGNIALIQSLEELPINQDFYNMKEFIYGYIRKSIFASLKEQQESDTIENIVMEKSNKIFLALNELEEELGRKANIHELSMFMKVSEEEITDVLELAGDILGLDSDHHHDNHQHCNHDHGSHHHNNYGHCEHDHCNHVHHEEEEMN